MNYLVLILGGLSGLIIYTIYRQKITKPCPYCAERIKKKAIFCRWCNKNLVNPINNTIETFSHAIIDDNLKKIPTYIALTVAKKYFKSQILAIQVVKLVKKAITKK